MSLFLGSLTGFQPKPKGPDELGPPSPRAHHHSGACRVFAYPGPGAPMIGSHKFLKRQGPGWLLVPELWNCEGPQRAQTQHLCRNVGLTGSCELRYFPLTRSQHPQKVVPLCGCYFDKLKLQGTVNLCSSILLFQLDAAETHQKYSVL